MTDATDSPSIRKRSPNFPGISLPKAVERAREIWNEAKNFPVPIATITKYWGYSSPTTGPASVTYAALKRYGLLDEEGTGAERVANLSQLAVTILNPNAGQQDAIQKAALMPDLIREWWDIYGVDVPPEPTLNWQYVINGPWAEEGLSTFVRVYRETIAFAKLVKQSSLDGEIEVSGGQDDDDETVQNGVDAARHAADEAARLQAERRDRDERRRPGMLTVPVLLQDSDPVIVEFPGKLTEDDWEYFLTQLAGMKRGVVRREASPAPAAPAHTSEGD